MGKNFRPCSQQACEKCREIVVSFARYLALNICHGGERDVKARLNGRATDDSQSLWDFLVPRAVDVVNGNFLILLLSACAESWREPEWLYRRV
jgi:hypothetical protein